MSTRPHHKTALFLARLVSDQGAPLIWPEFGVDYLFRAPAAASGLINRRLWSFVAMLATAQSLTGAGKANEALKVSRGRGAEWAAKLLTTGA